MKIIKGDKIVVVSGKDKGKTGKVIKALPESLKIVIDGINIRKKHVRPKKEGQKGQVVQSPAPLDVSNVKLLCPKCEKAVRVGYKIKEGEKNRFCKMCDADI